MATTGQVVGYLVKIYTGTAPGTAITCQTEASLELGVNMTDTTCKDTDPGWESKKPSRKNWSMSGSGYFSYDGTNGFSQLFAAYLAGTAVTVRISTGVTGDKAYSGSAFVESLSKTAGIDDTVSFDFTFAGNGAIAETTI